MAETNYERDDMPLSGEAEETGAFIPLSESMPEEFEPSVQDSDFPDDDGNDGRFIKAEKLLSTATLTLSVLLMLGSMAFWWYFVSRLTICPAAVANRELYPPMLICCAGSALVCAVAQGFLRRPITPENWMVNICISGAVTAIIMTLFNTFALGHPFAWQDVITSLCFSVSGCALPAAIFYILRALAVLLTGHLHRENSKDRKQLHAAVRAQCESRFR